MYILFLILVPEVCKNCAECRKEADGSFSCVVRGSTSTSTTSPKPLILGNTNFLMIFWNWSYFLEQWVDTQAFSFGIVNSWFKVPWFQIFIYSDYKEADDAKTMTCVMGQNQIMDLGFGYCENQEQGQIQINMNYSIMIHGSIWHVTIFFLDGTKAFSLLLLTLYKYIFK